MTTKQIFLLKPQDQNYHTYLIWADDEVSARSNTVDTAPAGRLGNQVDLAVTAEESRYYQDNKKVDCSKLSVNDYSVKYENEEKIVILYQKKQYQLSKNDPEMVD